MSDAYHLRPAIHAGLSVASLLTLPLFVTEYVLGTKLYRDPPGGRYRRVTWARGGPRTESPVILSRLCQTQAVVDAPRRTG
jgi:hypothetical protein